jgi:hypothetical protein
VHNLFDKMEFAFKPSHLVVDELNYELAIRGIQSSRSVEEKRKILARQLEKDKSHSGCTLKLEEYDCNFDTEATAINCSFDAIATLIADFEGTTNDSIYKRAVSRINHVTGRVQRLQLPEEGAAEAETFKKEAFTTCCKLDADLHAKLQTTVVPPLTHDESFMQPIINVAPPTVTCSSRSVPISDWKIKFGGDAKEVYNFLDRVNEYSQARGVTEGELFKAAAEFFIGDAFLWFLQIKPTLHSWVSLVEQLKADFLPPHAEDDIWDSIKSRKQNRNESIVIFSAVMENLFKRLSRPPHETTKVNCIRKNLLPEYISHLALTDIDTVANLVKLCKKLEEANYLKNKSMRPKVSEVCTSCQTCRQVDTLQPEDRPSTSKTMSSTSSFNRSKFQNKSNSNNFNKNSSVKKERSYVRNQTKDSEIESTRENIAGTNEILCWNCNLPNHSFRNCSAKRNKFCYRCGLSGVTIKTCSKCSKN